MIPRKLVRRMIAATINAINESAACEVWRAPR